MDELQKDAYDIADGVALGPDWLSEDRVNEVAEYLVTWAIQQTDESTEENAQTEFRNIIERALIRAYMVGALDAMNVYAGGGLLNAELVEKLMRDGQATITLSIT